MACVRAVLVLGSILGTLAGARAAHACGGFFCNQPQPNGPLPIAQAAENVLFVMDTDAQGVHRVEAHIQIAYTGPATSFSWIVPVTTVPTVDVGWDILFDRIEPPTRPSFQLMTVVDGRCKGGGGGVGCGGLAGSSAAGAKSDNGGPGVSPAVDVLSQGSAGPYDYVVVRSEEGATLRNWLTTNGYFVSPESEQIVDDYVAGGYSFVAVRLMVGQDTSAIRPIVLRLQSSEACLPLKLTAIVPATMAGIYLLMILYFKSKGGYRGGPVTDRGPLVGTPERPLIRPSRCSSLACGSKRERRNGS